MAWALYEWLTDIAALAAPAYLRHRARLGKEDPARLGERFGRTSQKRPPGSLIWAHAASVGESLSLLPVLEKLQARVPRAAIVMTTGTVTSARLMATRLPAGMLHQFVPIDQRAAVRRFLDHWRPNLALIVESELWPNLLRATAARGVPIVLLNGRLSARSFHRWQGWPHVGRALFENFSLVLAQDETQMARFSALGARDVKTLGDLKAAAPPLPADANDLAALRAAIGERPVWLAASTHPGEEDVVIAAHRALSQKYPGLLTLLAPRHPSRANAVAGLIETAGLTCHRRSAGVLPSPDTEIYLIDTMGELGLFYRAARIVLVAGSLGTVGGHNPLEAAALGCAVLHGPDTVNSAAATLALDDAGGALAVHGLSDLTAALDTMLGDPAKVATMGIAGQNTALAARVVIDRVMMALEPWIVGL